MSGEEDRIIGLLRGLDVDPDRPARVDLAGAVREARRRRRSRRTMSVSAAGLAVVAAVAVPLLPGGGPPADRPPAVWPAAPSAAGDPSPTPVPVPPDPSTCAVEPLKVPGGHARSLVTGGDPTGRFLAGRSYPADGRGNPVIIWDGDRPREYQLPGADQRMVDVSPTGVAVGSTYVGDRPEPWTIRDGRPARLPGVRTGQATAVSDDGRIVGARLVDDRQTPVLWSSPDAPAVDLPMPDRGWMGIAVGVDSAGTVVGKLQDGKRGGFRAVVWRTGGGPDLLPLPEPELLPLPEVEGGTATEFAPLTYQGGWITGTAFREVDGVRYEQPARYHLPTGRYLPLPRPAAPAPTPSDDGAGTAPGGGPASPSAPGGVTSGDSFGAPDPPGGSLGDSVWRGFVAHAGNGQGWVVGSTGLTRAGLLTDAGLMSLLDREVGSGRYATVAVTVSDDGRVMGGQLALKWDGVGAASRAVRWRCR